MPSWIRSIKIKLAALGPGMLVTSAFIGPGTVTICSLAGFQYGFELLWALLFSIIATIVLQEMCARLGLITQKGLAEWIRTELKSKYIKIIGSVLVLSAVVIGNGAYEAGNITGASLGWRLVLDDTNQNDLYSDLRVPIIAIGLVSFLLLISGSYKVIEKALIGLVCCMSLVFIATAIAAGPDLADLYEGLLIPSIPDGSILLIISLIGTTIVPYNLFLHSASISGKWHKPESLPLVRFDTFASIVLGGVVSIAIIICSTVASVNNPGSEMSIAHLASQLTPILGNWSKYFFATGLFAAGISSAITAPLAAAYTAAGILGFSPTVENKYFRVIAISILLLGVLSSLAGFKPIQVIHFAQFTNGLLLPSIAIFLLWIMNKKEILGDYANNIWQNALAILIVAITIILGVKSIISLW